jgi:copper chaperone CopZ
VINSARKAAEADSFINQTNFNNKACENCAEKIDEILQSVNGNSGIVTVNQAAGNNNNQGSVLTAAIDDFGDGTGNGGTNGTGFFGYAEAQAAVDQRNGWVLNEEPGAHDPAPNEVDSVAILFRESDIVDSINQNLGAVMVNQATGHMNNQANNIVLAVSFDGLGGVALTEAELGQETSNNISSESDVIKSVFMVDSVNGNKGVILVNQAGGNMTNQANVLSLGAAAVSGSLVSKL